MGKKLVLSILAVGILAFGYADYANAIPISVSATSDTFITKHSGLGGSSSTHGSATDMWLIGIEDYRSFPLIRFDLTPFVGSVVNGSTATLQLDLIGSWGHNTGITQSVSVRQVLTDWTEGSSSFANFGGTGFNEASHTGADLITKYVTFNGHTESILFTIPSSVVQGWIDNAGTNYGLIMISNTNAYRKDLVFASREGAASPSLSFDATPVPVPATMLLFGSGLVCLVGTRLRRKKK